MDEARSPGANEPKVVRVRRRSKVLSTPAFGCLRDTPAINITTGCLHNCVYCYARGFPAAPPEGEVHLYENVPQLLRDELSRRRRLPAWVTFSTASDLFQNHPEIHEVTFETLKILLERGVGVSFLSKGAIPDDCVNLFASFRNLVKARIGLVSLDEEYARLFEPRAAHPRKRLSQVRVLRACGIETGVRLDPLIHGVTDGDDALDHLFKRVGRAGITEASAGFLAMRPELMRQFSRGLPPALASQVLSSYRGEPFQQVISSARTRLLPKQVRIMASERIKKTALRYGVRCSICGCKNPDLPFEPCYPWIEPQQNLPLFAPRGA